ncbi:Ribokinase-like protein, partial [Parasitella parasitica]
MCLDTVPVFASIGSLIIDDIIYKDGRKAHNVLGGAGVFAVYGMRLWQPNDQSKNVGYIIHKGFDYPKEIDEQINQLGLSLITKFHSDKHTTRGLNTFGNNDHRDFEYIHPIIRATTDDFPGDWIKSVKILHLICSPERAIDIVDQWKQRELDLGASRKTKFLWEPLPWACLPENLDLIYKAVERVDIVTPNHEELAEMLGSKFDTILRRHNNKIKDSIEYCGEQFMKKIGDKYVVLVVRCSKFGAMTMTSDMPGLAHWTPAFWSWKTDGDHVVDVTGAGNSFCGGYCYGYIHTDGNVKESALYGAVSASYTVEQVGVPVYHNGDESWNSGASPKVRLDQLRNTSCVF